MATNTVQTDSKVILRTDRGYDRLELERAGLRYVGVIDYDDLHRFDRGVTEAYLFSKRSAGIAARYSLILYVDFENRRGIDSMGELIDMRGER